uniref:Mitochondrial ribosome-associated GTPase 1 n=1 Tax=Molossus molossus TaxID=27622 RepID=A0A7J8DQA3_MOLMO|nr:hypothetical protein HJG59_009233 [Molossus molossus]
MKLIPLALCSAARAAWRESFPLGGRDVARWFPGHMAKGLKKMQSSLKLVDCIIEVHDARIPLSGRNPLFQETLGIKPHLLILNKMDLADLKEQQKIIQHLEGEGLKNVIFTNCIKDENIKQVIPKVTELVGSSYRYHRGENVEFCIMVIGVPNVGKSSLINSLRRQHLRKGKATRVGGEPGITRAVMSRIQVCERPLMFLLDTPGVLAPRIESVETGLKLALCGTVLDHLVGEETLADYLLYTLNRHQLFGYVQHYGLGEACDDVASVLKRVAVRLGKTQKVKVLTGTGEAWGLGTSHEAGLAVEGRTSWGHEAVLGVKVLVQPPCRRPGRAGCVVPTPSSPASVPTPSSPASVPTPSSPASVPTPSSPASVPTPSSPASVPTPSSPALGVCRSAFFLRGPGVQAPQMPTLGSLSLKEG